MHPARSPALGQAELLRLDRFLHSGACGGEAMGLSRAHGFMTAAAAGPEALAPEEWIRLVFDEPVFATGDEAREMLGLALRLYRDIEQGLGREGDFRPVFEYARDGLGGTQMDARLWCQGFLAGLRLFQEHWTPPALDTLRDPLSIIVQLAGMPPRTMPATRGSATRSPSPPRPFTSTGMRSRSAGPHGCLHEAQRPRTRSPDGCMGTGRRSD